MEPPSISKRPFQSISCSFIPTLYLELRGLVPCCGRQPAGWQEQSRLIERENDCLRLRLEETEQQMRDKQIEYQRKEQLWNEERQSHLSIINVLSQDIVEQTNTVNRLVLDLNHTESILHQLGHALETAEKVDCPICLEPITEPRMASCGHVVCLSCCGLQTCWECRAPIDRFVTPFALRDLIEKLGRLRDHYRSSLSNHSDQALASFELDEMMEVDRTHDQ